jgi:photosystem II stability/assembly factor-like uncharacterized protein
LGSLSPDNQEDAMTTTAGSATQEQRAGRLLDLYLITADGLLKGHTNPGDERVVLTSRAWEGELFRDVAPDPFRPGHLYAVTMTDVFSSEDDGETWKLLPAGGLTYREIFTLAVHPTRPDEIYVGTLPAAVFVSRDGGMSFSDLTTFRDLPDYDRWTVPPPPHVAHIRKIVLDARVPDEILAGIEEGGVARSRDAGATWENISGPASDSAYPPPNPTGLAPYAGMAEHTPGRVYRDVHEVLRDPDDLDRIYASTGAGTFRTEDGGRAWAKLAYGLDNDRGYAVSLALHRANPRRLFLAFARNGPGQWIGWRSARSGPFNPPRGTGRPDAPGALCSVLRSDDGGDTWTETGGGLPQAHPYMICSIETHPNDPDVVYVAYTDGSVFETTDGGETWQQVLSGIEKLFGLRLNQPGSVGAGPSS